MLIKEHPGGSSCHKNINCANIQYELYSVLFFKAIKSLLRCLRMIPFDRWVECDKNRDDVFFTGRRSYIPASFNNDKPYKSFLHFMNRILWFVHSAVNPLTLIVEKCVFCLKSYIWLRENVRLLRACSNFVPLDLNKTQDQLSRCIDCV